MADLDALVRLPNGEAALPKDALLSCLAEKPCLVLGLAWAADWQTFDDFAVAIIVTNHKRMLPESDYAPTYRCVAFEHLPYILTHGCDVVPTDAVLWVDRTPRKALEYGGETKVMMVFDARKLKNSGVEVRANIAPDELKRIREDYPTQLETTDGEYLWLSHLPEDDRRVGSPYEAQHGRWIKGDPWEALRLVIIFAHDRTLFHGLAEKMLAQNSGEPR